MNRRVCAALLAFGVALSLGADASATSVQKMSLSDLARRSDAIVLARVEDEVARRDADNEIYTYITLKVLEPVKGPKSERKSTKGPDNGNLITIRQLGGTLDGVASVVSGMPTFRHGEEVVVFLTQRDAAGYPWVMGLQQGKYSVTMDDKGRKHVVNELDGIRLLSPDGTSEEERGVSARQPLTSFLDGIRTQIDADDKPEVDPTVPTE